VVDDQEWERSFGGLQFQAELLAESFDKGRGSRFGRWIGIGLGRANGLRGKFDGEVVAAAEAVWSTIG
jgi:hypothetical protein